MTGCRSEGELRAYLDRELTPTELNSVAGHVAECGNCSKTLEELERRAVRIAALMDDLQAVAAVAVPARRREWRWAAAGLALAAGVALTFVVIPRKPAGPVAAVVPATAPQAPPVNASVPFSGKVAAEKVAPPARAKRQPPARAREAEYFLALDDEPIEMGVIQRVKLGPASIPADVVFSPDGRARAIRLVSNSDSKGERQ